jgi:hypothetical protein
MKGINGINTENIAIFWRFNRVDIFVLFFRTLKKNIEIFVIILFLENLMVYVCSMPGVRPFGFR